MVPGEEGRIPIRRMQHKKHITKVMFLSAMARPQTDHAKKKFFDGKVGLWPFVEVVPAQRTSSNRPAGMMVTKPVNVDRGRMRRMSRMLIDKVFPAVREKIPCKWKVVTVQQDNDPPHMKKGDKDLASALGKKRGKSF